ncbi:TonB-dependent receptor [Methylocystis sp. MJC1]|uniref:TonB-dependent receptor n=1 Tax=Methylocystis sp. MJC1 TaxID=2654282 RepID=UPI001C1E25C4|nr:TonB-dependent receptor [Methylocystis sp. MJC1]MBU6527693.1 TonB-dependent receptor [Methylocystis sp. MJC1]UZX10629.1 TonB-dependent receptor [Methylocystis sp. MJC1]
MLKQHANRISLFVLSFVLASPTAFAMHTLPTIDVGGAKARQTQRGNATWTGRAVARARTSAPTISTPTTEAGLAAAGENVDPKSSYRNAPVTSSSTRSFTGNQVTSRSYEQPGQALEIVPGLIVSQHSGAGKANQYFLRGFALDHGYDIGLTIDGMPINQASHVHSNGYADANFIIPELFSSVDVRKGPYFADEGQFSSVGAIHMQYLNSAPKGFVTATGGSFGYGRLLGVKSYAVGGGDLLMALELNNYNGPWERPDEQRKINGVARWSMGTETNGLAVTAMAYSNHWFATDQIPMHDVAMGLMSRWGTQDPSDGGNATRYSLSMRWSETNKTDFSRFEGYLIRTTTNLYDDFTYNLTNPLPLNDQVHQFDRRSMYGINALHGWNYSFASKPVETRVGFQSRYDEIRNGSGDSFFRQQYDEVRNDYLKNFSHGLWTDTTVYWTPWFRTTGGFRLDYVHGSVNSVLNPALAPGWFTGTPFILGTANDGQLGRWFTSPKAGAVFGPFQDIAHSEFFLNFGEGFREEDLRGSVAHWDPAAGAYGPNNQLLTKTRGAEAGVRAKPFPGLDTTLSLFWQDFDAENVFNGDAGVTGYGRPGRRLGFEWTGNYAPTTWINAYAEVTGTHARFRGSDAPQQAAYLQLVTTGAGDPLFPFNIPGNAPGNYLMLAPVWVAKSGIDLGEKTGWFGGLYYRYFGSRPLTEDGQIKSSAMATVNARVGYRLENGWKLQVDAFNITNNRSSAIDYGYGAFARQDYFLFPGYAGGSNGIMDRYFKPQDPPAVRLTLSGPLTVLDQPQGLAAKF